MPRGRKKTLIEKLVEPKPPLSKTDVNIAIAEGILKSYKSMDEARQKEKEPTPITDETLCNFRNMHTEKQTPCILEKGHKGNHSDGKYEWSDAAGTPTRKHA
jgi:hypothetical protein